MRAAIDGVSPALLRTLEGFHVWAAYQMAGMMPHKKNDGKWEYSDSEEVLEVAGLFNFDKYIGVRRATVLCFISERRIYKLCQARSAAPASKPIGVSSH